MPIHDNVIDKLDRSHFTDEYKNSIFMIWYRSGKVNPTALLGIIPPNSDDKKPTRITLGNWVDDFRPRAEELDEVVKDELDGRLVKEKIEMLNRHADIALEIQGKALDYLRDKDHSDLNAASAVRLLVEGIRIEKESRGIPKILSKMASMTDDDLLKKAEELLLRSPITEMEVITDENTDELPNL
jgi:hypothetical protein